MSVDYKKHYISLLDSIKISCYEVSSLVYNDLGFEVGTEGEKGYHSHSCLYKGCSIISDVDGGVNVIFPSIYKVPPKYGHVFYDRHFVSLLKATEFIDELGIKDFSDWYKELSKKI